MKKIFLAGATGSIGKNVFYCIDSLNHHAKNRREKNHIAGVAIHRNGKALLDCFRKLQKQERDFHPPEVIASTDPSTAAALQKDFPQARIFTSISKAIQATDYDVMINALSGSVGLHATLPALKQRKKILLANKESLVMAGGIINRLLKKQKVELIPIDSEHSALYHLLHPYHPREINRLILTASGGPFYKNHKQNPSVEEALKHPNWKMGKKITIDSATMINKGLEVIEAHHLFDFPYEQIDVIIHPQSLVHSLIETKDGVLYAQIGSTDMRHPIFSALSHPKMASHNLPPFQLHRYKRLEFHKPNFLRFPMLRLAYDCGKKEVEDGRNYGAVMNAANEEAVTLFLEKKISFSRIYSLTRFMVESYSGKKLTRIDQIDEIIELDREIKIKTKEKAENK